MIDRRAGLLVHPTSLPGPFGAGDLGPVTVRFLDWAAEAAQSVWQVLPLGPTFAGAGYSPYCCPSAFAGNPLLVSPARLLEAGWLPDAIGPVPEFPEESVEFERLEAWKLAVLRQSWELFRRQARTDDRRDLEAFIEHPIQTPWLEDWALFAALKLHHGGSAWPSWDRELRQREPSALRLAGRDLADEVAFARYVQFLFFRQWDSIHAEARERGIDLLGDVPFYVALDSADVWARPDLFLLDREGRPIRVAGVPPDYFSSSGQLWGNPIYDWERMAAEDYAWWIARLRVNLRLADRVRLDHFRAFVAYWEVDGDRTDAIGGRWVPGPGRALFDALRRALGGLPFVAEDLGSITEDVHAMRREFGLPGMRVLQFAFDGADGEHRPERHPRDAVVYTGTHDNDTVRGWFEALAPERRADVLASLGTGEESVVWRMIETAYESVAGLAVIPLQDVFGLDGHSRMNRPGVAAGNWRWRTAARRMSPELAERLRGLAARTGRARGDPGGRRL